MSHVITRDRPGLGDLENAIGIVNTAAILIDSLPAPEITSISPTEHVEKDAFPLTVEGKNFNGECVVYVGSLWCTTRHTSSTKLEADIPATDAGSYVITVKGPGGDSNGKPLTIKPKPSNPPRISSIEPTSQPEGEPFTLAVYGENFNGDAKVYIGIQERPTEWKSPGSLTAKMDALSASDGYDHAGSYEISVREGGEPDSNGKTLTITAKPRAPIIDSIDPESIEEDKQPFTLTVKGKNFHDDDSIFIDSHSLVTKRDLPTRLYAENMHGLDVGSYHITVNGLAGLSDPKELRITEKPPPMPELDRIYPDSVEKGKSTTFLLTGSNFRDDLKLIGEWPGDDAKWPFDLDGSQKARFHLANPSYNTAVHFYDPVNDRSTDKVHYYVREPEPPHEDRLTLQSVTPDHTDVDEATEFTLRGTGFHEGLQLLAGGMDWTAGVKWHSSTEAVFAAKWSEEQVNILHGQVPVSLHDRDNNINTDVLHIHIAPPEIKYIGPNPVPVADGGKTPDLVLAGEHLRKGGKILVNGQPAGESLIKIVYEGYPENLKLHVNEGLAQLVVNAGPTRDHPIQWQNPDGQNSNTYMLHFKKA